MGWKCATEIWAIFFEYLGFKEVMEKAQANSEANKSDKIFERTDNLYGSYGSNNNNDDDE